MAMRNMNWTMKGLDTDNPSCIQSAEELLALINRKGFLPLFRNDISGFSVEEYTCAGNWWSGKVQNDPWLWRELVIRNKGAVYGRFFNRKAGFISLEWFPHFANYRRNGYDFDALCDDGEVSLKLRNYMSTLRPRDSLYKKLFTYEIKEMLGITAKKASEFESVMTSLQMYTYVCVCDFQPKINKKGEPYGKGVSCYATPEAILGYDYVTSMYNTEIEKSKNNIWVFMKDQYPNIDYKQFEKYLDFL